jgi:hypothetical protein
MTSVDELAETFRGAMIGVLEDDAYWLGVPASGQEGDLELATEDWSLVLESWPAGIGFFATDDEPETERIAELRIALEAMLGDVLPVIAGVNKWAGNGIVVALQRTTDPLSNALAELIKD